MHYFDHSATTPVHPNVQELISTIQGSTYGNASSTHTLGRKAKSILEKARIQVATAINAKPDQIIFTSGGSESNNQVLWSLIYKDKKHIITTAIEHPAILQVLKTLEQFGISYDSISVKKNGMINFREFEKSFREETGLISVMLANNEVGTIQPLQKIVNTSKKKSIPVHTDAVQCLGKIPINVDEIGIDFLSLSAHKFYGPKGSGILYIRDKEFISPFIIGGGQENGLRGGTENIALIAGMGLAAEIATKNIFDRAKYITELEIQFKKGLKSFFPDAFFNGDKINKLPGLISVSFPGFKSDIMMAKLDRAGMGVSNGSACGSGIVKPSEILKAMGVDDNLNKSTLRISLGCTNTANEITDLLSVINSIVNT